MKKTVNPIVKFNSGSPVLICNDCRIIIKENLTEEEAKGNTDIIYCEKCFIKHTKSINLCKI